MSLSPENKQTKLNELYEFGKSKGTLSYKEIMDRLIELEMDSSWIVFSKRWMPTASRW